jgi:putative flippase GtrA
MMTNVIKSFIDFAGLQPRFVRFLAIGVLNTAVGYALYIIGLEFHVAPTIALIFATTFGAIFNYFSTGRAVFGVHSLNRMPRFLLAYAIIYCFNLLILDVFLWFGLKPWLAQAFSLPIVVVVSYCILNFWVFWDRLHRND